MLHNTTLLMVITSPQKKVAALQRYSWHDTPKERTQLKRKDGSCCFTLGVIDNFLLDDVGHLWMGSGLYFYIVFSISIITTRCSSTLRINGDNSLGLGNLGVFAWKRLDFFVEQKQGPHMEFSGNGNLLSTGWARWIWWETREIRYFLSQTQSGLCLGPKRPAIKTFVNEVNYAFCGLISALLHHSLFQLKSQWNWPLLEKN